MSAELKIDLVDLLHETIDNRQKRIALTPIVQREVVKREFGQRVVDAILDRTDDGIDKEGRPFKKYSKAYIKSKTFDAYNKSAGEVNLELTGAMKADLSVTGVSRTAVVIGFNNSEQQEKALRHITGDGVPIRDFLGIPKAEQKEILEEIIKQYSDNSEILETIFLESIADLDTSVIEFDSNIILSAGENG